MKIRHFAIIGLSATMALLFAPLEIPAHAHGSGGMHGSGMHGKHFLHIGKNFRHAHLRRNFNQVPWWYSGYYAYPPASYDNGNNDNGYTQPSNIIYVLGSASVRSCQYNKETVIVPAESGGTREITVTRC